MTRLRLGLSLARWTLLLVGMILSGCAAQMAYRDGENLRKEGQAVEALKRYEDAMRQEPDSARYRLAVVNARAAVTGPKAAVTSQAASPATVGATSQTRPNDDATRHQTRVAAAQDALDATFQKPINIEFKDAPLKSVFEVISRSAGINFIFDREVKLDQKVTIFLRNTSIESAVKLTLNIHQLAHRNLDGNTVFVYPNTQVKIREYQPLTVRVFYLANAEAKTVAATLKTILKTRDLVTDDKLNMLIMRDTPEAIGLAEKLIEAHDVAQPEVMLEVEVLEVNRKRVQELGIRWPDQLSLAPIGAQSDNLTLADLWSVARDRTGRTVGAAVGSMNINARVVDADGEILANPRIRVHNRQKAKILIGDRVPNITSTSTSTGFVAESISYVDVGLKLDVEPIVYVNGEVAIDVALEVSTIVDQLKTQAGSIAYRIGTRSAQTVLRLKDGETQVLAGLLSNEERTSGNRVPGLGELPVANKLFGSQLDDANKTEIVLAITPRILRNIHKPGASSLEFDSGTESAIGGAGLSISGTPGAQSSVGPGRPSTPPPAGTSGSTPAGASSTTPAATTNSTPARDAEPRSPSTQTDGPAPAGVPGSADMRLQGPNEARRGENMTVQLLMQSGDPVVSLPMSIGFDPKAIQVLSVTEGDFLQSGGQSSFAHRIDPSGQVLITATSPTGATGPGVVATMTLRLLDTSPPQTTVRVTAAGPVGLQGKGIDLASPGPLIIKVGP